MTPATSDRNEALGEISLPEAPISELRQVLANRDKAVNDIQLMLDVERTHRAQAVGSPSPVVQDLLYATRVGTFEAASHGVSREDL